MDDTSRKSIPKPYQQKPPKEKPDESPVQEDKDSNFNGKTLPSRVHRDIEWPV